MMSDLRWADFTKHPDDIVRVIRCKDCKYRRPSHWPDLYAELMGRKCDGLGDEGFCSLGKMEGDENGNRSNDSNI